MLTAVFSLAGALVFGAADFLGGLAAKRVSSVLVTAVAAATGFVLLAAAAPFLGGAGARTTCSGACSPASPARSRSRCSTRASRSVR